MIASPLRRLPLLALVATRTCLRPRFRSFAGVGLVIALAVLTRPPNEGLLVAAALLPFAASGTWRSRLLWGGTIAIAAILPLSLYALYNSERYGDLTISRNGAAEIPFHANFGRIRAENGPASRRLAGVVERYVLALPPWRALHVDADTYFRAASGYETVHLFGLSDKLFGLGDDYGLLHAAAEEVPTQKGDLRVKGISLRRAARSLWQLIDVRASHEDRTKPSRWPVPPAMTRRGGTIVPNPAALPPPVPGVEYGFLSCANPEIARCILADPSVAYREPRRTSALPTDHADRQRLGCTTRNAARQRLARPPVRTRERASSAAVDLAPGRGGRARDPTPARGADHRLPLRSRRSGAPRRTLSPRAPRRSSRSRSYRRRTWPPSARSRGDDREPRRTGCVERSRVRQIGLPALSSGWCRWSRSSRSSSSRVRAIAGLAPTRW